MRKKVIAAAVAAVAIVVLVLVVALTAGGGDSSPAATQSGGPPVTEIAISADDSLFSRSEIRVPAGEHVLIHFTNLEAAPHNVAFYETDAAEEEIYVGKTIRGPDETTDYEFDAPQDPGTYFFRCDVHPVVMTGELIVQ